MSALRRNHYDSNPKGTIAPKSPAQVTSTASPTQANVASPNDFVEFHCPSCSHIVKTPSAAIGKKGKCPACGEVFTIPSSSNVNPKTSAVSKTSEGDPVASSDMDPPGHSPPAMQARPSAPAPKPNPQPPLPANSKLMPNSDSRLVPIPSPNLTPLPNSQLVRLPNSQLVPLPNSQLVPLPNSNLVSLPNSQLVPLPDAYHATAASNPFGDLSTPMPMAGSSPYQDDFMGAISAYQPPRQLPRVQISSAKLPSNAKTSKEADSLGNERIRKALSWRQ